MSGGMENISQREHRATVSTCAAAASQNGAERSSGTGTGRVAGVTGSPRPPAARRSVPTCSRARAGAARSARRAPARGAARVGRSSNCTGTVGSRYAGSPSITTSPMYSLASTCGSSSSSSTACTGAHGASICASSVFHSANVRLANSAVELGDALLRVLAARLRGRRSAGRRRGLGGPSSAAEVGPVAIRLEEHQADVATVLRAVGADERVHERASARHRARLLALERGEHVRRQRPHGDAEQRHVDDRAAVRCACA